MFGIPIDGPANVFCDTQGVVKNLSILELTLLKKQMQLTIMQFERQLQLVFCELERKI